MPGNSVVPHNTPGTVPATVPGTVPAKPTTPAPKPKYSDFNDKPCVPMHESTWVFDDMDLNDKGQLPEAHVDTAVT